MKCLGFFCDGGNTTRCSESAVDDVADGGNTAVYLHGGLKGRLRCLRLFVGHRRLSDAADSSAWGTLLPSFTSRMFLSVTHVAVTMTLVMFNVVVMFMMMVLRVVVMVRTAWWR